MAEYSRMAKGNFTATGTTEVVPLPFTPDYVELWNETYIKTKTASTVTRAWWDAKFIDTATGYNPTMVEGYTSGSAVNFDVVSNAPTNLGINAFSGGLAQQYGPLIGISAISSATQAVVTTTAAHGYTVGTTVVLQGIATASTNNMQLLNGVPFTIVAVGSTTTFTIQWNTVGGNYTTISGSPAGAYVKQVLYPFLYLPQDNIICAITLAATTTIVTSMYSNFEVGQQVAFRIPPLWGTTQLNSLPDVLIPGQPIYGYVQSVTDNWTFVVNINSSAYTAYNNNFTMTASTLSGLTYPQVLAVGDVNTGGLSFSGGALYPSPQFPISTNRVSTINGPAIKGAFVNNTQQGFTIGAGVCGSNIGTSVSILVSTNQIYWHAYAHDYGNP